MSELLTTHIDPTACPVCGKVLDCATSGDPEHPDARPGPGSLTLCIVCGAMLTYTESMSLRTLEEAEWDALDEDTQIHVMKLRRVLAQVKHNNPLPR